MTYKTSKEIYNRAVLNQQLEDAILKAIAVNPFKTFFERSYKGLVFTARKVNNHVIITYNENGKEIKHSFTL